MAEGPERPPATAGAVTGPHPPPPRWIGVLVAGLSALTFCVTYLVVVRTARGQRVDTEIWRLVLEQPDGIRRLLSDLARPTVLWVLGAIALVEFVRARAAQRWLSLMALLAVPMAYRMRESLGRPELGVGDLAWSTFPSTHAAAGFALLAGVAILGPRPVPRLTRWLLLGGAALVAVGNVSWYAHRPSDVLGSALLVVAMLALGYATRPSATR